MASATEKVFKITELLEAILYELDMDTLLFSQRVNKAFKATIDDSIKLQRVLWFQPTPLTKDQICRNQYKRNPFMRSKLNIEIDGYSNGCKETPINEDLTHNLFIYLNEFPRMNGSWQRMVPVLERRCPKFCSIALYHDNSKCEFFNPIDDDDYWESVPAGDASYCDAHSSGEPSFLHLSMGRVDEMPTLGEIVDFAEKWIREKGKMTTEQGEKEPKQGENDEETNGEEKIDEGETRP